FTATLGPHLAARVIDQNAPHEVRRDSKEMSPVLPVGISLCDQFHVGLMHQGSWLQGVIWPLTAQVADGQATEFLVNDRNEFAGGFLIAVCELSQQRGYVGRDGLHSVPPQALRASPGSGGSDCTPICAASPLFRGYFLCVCAVFPRK